VGKLENIEMLETYIDELGNEIENVKKASTFLKEIEVQNILVEKQLERVKQTNVTLEEIQTRFADKTKEFELQLQKNENRFQELNTTVVNSFFDTESYLKEQIGIIKQESSAVGNNVKELQSKTNLLETQVVSMSTTVTTVNNSVNEVHRQISQLNQGHLELKETVQQTNENQKQLAKRIDRNAIIITSIILVGIIITRII